MKFDALFAKWLSLHDASMSAGSRAAYTYAVRRFSDFCARRKLKVQDVTREHASAFMAESIDEIKGWTVMQQIKLLKRIFEWAMDTGLVLRNPVDTKKLPRLVRHRAERVAFTAEDYAAIMAVVGTAKPYWRLACGLAWHTGLRMVDVANLQWDSVHFDTKLLIVYPKKLERFEQRLEIPISDDLFDLLAARKVEYDKEEPSEFVQHEMMMAYKYGRNRLVEQFESLRKRADLGDGSFHSWRHGFISRMVNAGVDTVLLASITGQSLRQLAEYAHVSNLAKRNALAMGNTISPVPVGNAQSNQCF